MSSIELTRAEANMFVSIMNNETKTKIIKNLLKESKGLWHNEICRRVGGSKTTVHKHLEEIEDMGLISKQIGYENKSPKKSLIIYCIVEEHLDFFRKIIDLL